MEKKESKTRMIKVRVTEKQFNRIKILASHYGRGEISEWVRQTVFEHSVRPVSNDSVRKRKRIALAQSKKQTVISPHA